LPGWSGPLARLSEATLAVSTVLVISELLGTFAGFRRGPVVLVVVVVGATSVLSSRRVRMTGATAVPTTSRRSSSVAMQVGNGLALFIAVVVVLEWAAQLLVVYRHGMPGDTAIYHGPMSAHFAQTGWTTHYLYVTPGEAITFYPQNTELLQGVGIMLLHSDLLTPVGSVASLLLLLAAAWCVGRPWGAQWPVTGVVASIVAGSHYASSDAATAMNDLAAVAFLLVAVAVLGARRPWTTGQVGVAATAAGLALGTKLTMVIPVVALTVAVVILAPRRRRAPAAAWVSGMAAGAAFWYARNLVAVGNPIPSVRLHIGPLSLPAPSTPVTDHASRTLLGSIDLSAVRHVFIPGLSYIFGSAWVLLILPPVAGLLWGLFHSRDPFLRGLALVGTVGLAGYAVTPTTGFPPLFAVEIRYAFPSLMLGAVLAGIATSRYRDDVTVVLLALLAAGTAVAASADGGWWGGISGNAGLLLVVSGTVAVLTVLIGPASERALLRRASRSPGPVAAAGFLAVAVALMPLAWTVQRHYAEDRYKNFGGDMAPIIDALRNTKDQRVALAGYTAQLPFYGADLSNRVRYVGQTGPHGGFTDVASCPAWRRLVAQGGYQWVVTGRAFPGETGEPPQAEWTRSSPAVTQVIHNGRASLFRIDGLITAAGC
jgi:hypothetical protein